MQFAQHIGKAAWLTHRRASVCLSATEQVPLVRYKCSVLRSLQDAAAENSHYSLKCALSADNDNGALSIAGARHVHWTENAVAINKRPKKQWRHNDNGYASANTTIPVAVLSMATCVTVRRILWPLIRSAVLPAEMAATHDWTQRSIRQPGLYVMSRVDR